MSYRGEKGRLDGVVKFRYPREGEPVPRARFFATGIVSDNFNELIGVLSKAGTNNTWTGKTLRQPPASPKWLIFFGAGDITSGSYTLQLYQHDTSGQPIATQDFTIQIRPDVPKVRKLWVKVLSPATGDRFCADYFFAQGEFGPADKHIGDSMMTPAGGIPVHGNQPIEQGTDWFVDWPPLTENNNYTLVVSGIAGGSDTCTSLDVESAYCS
jgi:hypothetical protein